MEKKSAWLTELEKYPDLYIERSIREDISRVSTDISRLRQLLLNTNRYNFYVLGSKFRYIDDKIGEIETEVQQKWKEKIISDEFERKTLRFLSKTADNLQFAGQILGVSPVRGEIDNQFDWMSCQAKVHGRFLVMIYMNRAHDTISDYLG